MKVEKKPCCMLDKHNDLARSSRMLMLSRNACIESVIGTASEDERSMHRWLKMLATPQRKLLGLVNAVEEVEVVEEIHEVEIVGVLLLEGLEASAVEELRSSLDPSYLVRRQLLMWRSSNMMPRCRPKMWSWWKQSYAGAHSLLKSVAQYRTAHSLMLCKVVVGMAQ